jgi:hypothetical protein
MTTCIIEVLIQYESGSTNPTDCSNKNGTCLKKCCDKQEHLYRLKAF